MIPNIFLKSKDVVRIILCAALKGQAGGCVSRCLLLISQKIVKSVVADKELLDRLNLV